ncbi:MAG: hypothetical protein QW304_07855 [Thermoproteota archaeon]
MSERLITVGPGERIVILGAGIPKELPRPIPVPSPPPVRPLGGPMITKPLPSPPEKAEGPWWLPFVVARPAGTPTQVIGTSISGVVSNLVSRINSVRASLGLPPGVLSNLMARRGTQAQIEYQLAPEEVIGVESR